MKVQTISAEALSLFRVHVERRGNVIVDDSNRAAYEELARAGLMKAGHSFLHGRNSIYGLTKEGFERKAELLACARESDNGSTRLIERLSSDSSLHR